MNADEMHEAVKKQADRLARHGDMYAFLAGYMETLIPEDKRARVVRAAEKYADEQVARGAGKH